MENEKLCISVMEAADLLGIGKTAMYGLVKQPGFPIIKIGKSYRIRKAGLDEWLKDHEGKEVILD